MKYCDNCLDREMCAASELCLESGPLVPATGSDSLVSRFRKYRKFLRRAGLSFKDQDEIEAALIAMSTGVMDRMMELMKERDSWRNVAMKLAGAADMVRSPYRPEWRNTIEKIRVAFVDYDALIAAQSQNAEVCGGNPSASPTGSHS